MNKIQIFKIIIDIRTCKCGQLITEMSKAVGGDIFTMVCKECGISIGGNTPKKVVDVWNCAMHGFELKEL